MVKGLPHSEIEFHFNHFIIYRTIQSAFKVNYWVSLSKRNSTGCLSWWINYSNYDAGNKAGSIDAPGTVNSNNPGNYALSTYLKSFHLFK